MSTIKKQFQPIYFILMENAGKKLTGKLLEQLVDLMSPKVQKTFKLDENGNVTHIFCYYHKEWEDVSEVEYGKKSSTAHGLNTMCKEGVSNWTKQQRVFKKTKEELLQKVADGEIDASELNDLLAEAEEQAKLIVPREQ